MKILGVTGGIGSGKSTVSNIFKKYGGFIIDADKINHEIMAKDKPAYNEILDYFGKTILLQNREINRKKLGKTVFGNDDLSKKKLTKLTSINHKYVIEETLSIINYLNNNKNEYSFIVIDAPLLVEANLHEICDKIFVLYSDLDIRINRIMSRDNISKEETIKRIQNQMPFDELKKYADYIIYNNNSYDDLERDIAEILKNVINPLNI